MKQKTIKAQRANKTSDKIVQSTLTFDFIERVDSLIRRYRRALKELAKFN